MPGHSPAGTVYRVSYVVVLITGAVLGLLAGLRLGGRRALWSLAMHDYAANKKRGGLSG